MPEAFLKPFSLESSDVRDIYVANESNLELRGQRFEILPIISESTLTFSDLGLDPFLCSCRE